MSHVTVKALRLVYFAIAILTMGRQRVKQTGTTIIWSLIYVNLILCGHVRN